MKIYFLILKLQYLYYFYILAENNNERQFVFENLTGLIALLCIQLKCITQVAFFFCLFLYVFVAQLLTFKVLSACFDHHTS